MNMKIRKSLILNFFLFVFVIASFTLTGCKSIADKKVSANAETEEIYTCPMHPQIIRHEPGNCPICGMPLVKKENANREISKVDLSTLLQAGNNTVVSSITVTTMQFAKQEIQLDALGS